MRRLNIVYNRRALIGPRIAVAVVSWQLIGRRELFALVLQLALLAQAQLQLGDALVHLGDLALARREDLALRGDARALLLVQLVAQLKHTVTSPVSHSQTLQ